VNWVTIYDVRNGWTLWIAGASSICLLILFSLILFSSMRVIHMTSDRLRKRDQLIGAFSLCFASGSLMALSLWLAVSDYRHRSDLKFGHFVEVEGLIEDAHIEQAVHSARHVFFRVGLRWFALPYDHPQDCFPHDGEPIKVAFEASADD
jgi:hypothetical protein